LGTAGMVTSALLDPREYSSASGLLFISSAATMVAGSLYLRGYGTNLQRAVNIYNKRLYESQTTPSAVSFHLTPLKTGLVWSF